MGLRVNAAFVRTEIVQKTKPNKQA